jgi:D-xylose transport system permease protein
MVFVIVTGGIDLSVGYGSGFVSVCVAGMFYYGVADRWVSALFPNAGTAEHQFYAAVIAVVVGLVIGILIGLYQGMVISRLAVPPFIVTLGGMYIFKSGILIVTKGRSLFISANDVFKSIAQGKVPPWIGLAIAAAIAAILFIKIFRTRARKAKYGVAPGSLWLDLAKSAAFSALVFGYVLIVNRTFETPPTDFTPPKGVPVLVLILGVIALLMHYISRNTRFGRYTYAIGGNREAARLSGISIQRSILMVYVTMGLLMGISGIALAADVGTGTTSAGQGYELDVIASCILGGTSTLGGEGTIFGAVVGALIMQSLTNGLTMSNVDSNYQYLIKGVVLILAVFADIQFKKKRA